MIALYDRVVVADTPRVGEAETGRVVEWSPTGDSALVLLDDPHATEWPGDRRLVWVSEGRLSPEVAS